ncbi:MAG TPA: gliding motility-associated C-terminal domain-containing protein [Saprospiraceae bacterium]|nr:gliding motility-associated C-terminal domain-containing protein [Saprospiraceae bacterium]
MHISSLAYTLCLALMVSACQKEDQLFLKGCCGNEAIIDSFGNAHIYVPNIFTPNGDDLNDYLFILGDSIEHIISLEVRDRNEINVYRIGDIPYHGHKHTWDGKVNGAVQKGLYSFSLTLESEDGNIGYFEGKVCNYPCGLMEGEEMISITGCYFASQYIDPHIMVEITFPDYPGCFK